MSELVMDTDEARLYRGDCRTVMAGLPDSSVDSIVTDPPYELGFMGRQWDRSGIAFDPEVWAQALRVLKPGGHLLAFGGTRTWHRVAVAVEDAGFEIRDSIAWLYGSGFPKSMDVSKAIDKAAGAEREVIGTAKRSQNRSEGWDRPWMREQMDALGGNGMAEHAITAPATEAAKAWEGWGTALKPAHEPVVVARKPFQGTVAANVLAHGTGAINIDATRIPTEDNLNGGGATTSVSEGWDRPFRHDAESIERLKWETAKKVEKAEALGRWPANVLLDESQAEVLDEQAGILTSGLMKARTARAPRKGGTIYGADQRNITAGDTYADSGGASRFFYVAKAPAHERPEIDGVQHATVKPLTLMRYLVKLVTPPGGTVLEPFAGSGTTLEAAILEGFSCIGIELDEDGTHIPLIMQRLGKPLTPAMF